MATFITELAIALEKENIFNPFLPLNVLVSV
jgi:hypothetical protein